MRLLLIEMCLFYLILTLSSVVIEITAAFTMLIYYVQNMRDAGGMLCDRSQCPFVPREAITCGMCTTGVI